MSEKSGYSFEDARRIVAEIESKKLTRGTYVVAPWGFESKTHYYVISGAAEWLENADESYRPEDECFALVDKITGAVSYQEVPRAGGKLEIDLRDVTPVGELACS